MGNFESFYGKKVGTGMDKVKDFVLIASVEPNGTKTVAQALTELETLAGTYDIKNSYITNDAYILHPVYSMTKTYSAVMSPSVSQQYMMIISITNHTEYEGFMSGNLTDMSSSVLTRTISLYEYK